MIDSEVERLRRLRGSALRVRAVARSLGGSQSTLNDPLLSRSACAAWRVARTVSGRLRAHPHASFQKDAGLGLLVSNSIAATAAALGASSRLRAFQGFEAQLKALARQLDDARALTWASDLSDLFGRSQHEIRSLLAAVECETHRTGEGSAARRVLPVQRRLAPLVSQTQNSAAPADRDWPYLAF
jgi:hypothetical protein